MALGELYKPSGKALEHAQAVLEVQDPYAVNVALGCPLGCSYCYVHRAIRQSRESAMQVRYPKAEPAELVERQLDRGLKPEGVFISFLTEPLLPSVRESTERLVSMLAARGIRTAVSSKVGVVSVPSVRNGMTVVSLDEDFWKRYEPRAPPPLERIRMLREAHDRDEYTWAAMEPYPCSAIWKQDVLDVLEELHFVDFIIKGKWNYDPRGGTDEARTEYLGIMSRFSDFCKSNGIRHHVKADTLDFIRGAGGPVQGGECDG